jgi:pimeloyl-ACP methyl ester carboxylesterase
MYMKPVFKKVGLGVGSVITVIALLGGTLYLRLGTTGAPLGASRDAYIVMKEVPCQKDYGGGRCGVVTAPLDYQGRDSGAIEVGFIYYPATNPFADEKRVVQLVSGGPGLSMSGFMGGGITKMIRLGFNKTALLAIDPRGVGRSTRLMCPKASKDGGQTSDLDSHQVERCAIEAGPTRVHYNTENTVRDFERVKRALGIGKVDLLGFSYGTNASIVYATLFPNEIRSIILDGSYAFQKTELFLQDFHAALIRQIVTACKTSRECSAEQGLSALNNVVATLRAKPRPLTLPARKYKLPENPLLDVKLLVTMTRFLPGSLADKHYYPLLGALLKADKGDWADLEALAKIWMVFAVDPSLSTADAGEANSPALGRAVDCAEVDTYWDPSAPLDERIKQSRAALDASDARGDVRPFMTREWLSGQDLRSGCLRYPAAPKGYEVAKRYATIDQFPQHVPVLLLNGDLDMNTPLESGQAVAKTFKNAYFARFKYNEHLIIVGNMCGARMAVDFVNNLKVVDPSACLDSGRLALDIHNLPPLIKDYMAGKPIL